MNEARVFLALAGLLHDIGKFRQRAFWDVGGPSHEEQAAQWVEQELLPRLAFLPREDRRRLVAAIREHHGRPYDRDARALIVADRLASGERVDREGEEPGRPPKEPLISVFTAVQLSGSPRPEAVWAYGTAPLPRSPEDPTAWEPLFPRPRDQVQVAYLPLWWEFETAVANVHPDVWARPDTALRALMALLRAYTWCIPAAAWRDEPDVSLYDHLRMTAALAVCVGDQEVETIARWEEQTGRGKFPAEEVALLVGGDLSGIQRFLYAISAAGAARGLRGRSAYLSLVSDAAVLFILRELDLPPTQVVYSSGGHFYLLAPLSAREALPDLARRLTEVLVEAHGGDLALVLDAVTLTGRDFSVREGRLPLRWQALTRRLADRKAQRFRELLATHHAVIVGPFGGGGQARRCAICHEEETPHEPRVRRRVQDVEGTPKCSLCLSFEDLGRQLGHGPAWMIVAARESPPARELEWHTVLAHLGVEVFFLDEQANPVREGDTVVRLNRADLASTDVPVADFRWLPVYAPLDEQGSIRELAAMAHDARGAPYWACLRMDVDNLGQIFAHGLGERYSLSRVATLSHLLSLFFEGYVPHLMGRLDPERRHLYLIYSGGDDMLLIGSWDRVLEAALEVRKKFRCFTGHNPSLTLSGAIGLYREKFPLYQAAGETGAALERAKDFRHPDGHEKDAFTFFGVTVSWEDAFWMQEWADKLQRLLEAPDPPHRLSRAFLYKLVGIAANLGAEEALLRRREYTPADLARLVGYHRAKWRLVYVLAREPKGVQDTLQAFQAQVLAENARRLALLRPLSRWLELLTRRR